MGLLASGHVVEKSLGGTWIASNERISAWCNIELLGGWSCSIAATTDPVVVDSGILYDVCLIAVVAVAVED
jgi:hypothetical protein